ncbi:hypothetical protein [Dactylosporangium darangshiense]|uniref:Integral membrane protein n=1 Tax=Dactylosporangium darangshiense TaxID=579108 RepID=A0ABP8DUL8_9ACTN
MQCAFVAAATITAAAVSYRFHGPVPYTLTVGWALAGVAVSATVAGLPPLTVTAATGLLVVAASAALGRRRRTPRSAH